MNKLPAGKVRWAALVALMFVFGVLAQVAKWQPGNDFGSVRNAYATAAPTSTATATATQTVAAYPAATPTVSAGSGASAGSPCANISTTGLVIGQSTCQDQSTSPWAIYIWNGTTWVKPKSLPRGLTPPSGAADQSLWISTADVVDSLFICNANGENSGPVCPGLRCTHQCGTWSAVIIPNYVPHFP